MTRVSYSRVFDKPNRSWNRSTSTNHAVFQPCSVSSYAFADCSHLWLLLRSYGNVRWRDILCFNPICSLRPFLSIPITYKHPGSQSRLPACDLCVGFILRQGFSPSLRPLSHWGVSAVDSLPFILFGREYKALPLPRLSGQIPVDNIGPIIGEPIRTYDEHSLWPRASECMKSTL